MTDTFIIAGRTIDGSVYFGPFGWQHDSRLAYVMSETDAAEIAARERAREESRPGRSPDNGVYQIATHRREKPVLYSLADYESDIAESQALDALYASQEEW